MAHDHSHGDRSAYYLNQLFTIAVCGALGGVSIMLWQSGKLRFMLADKFHLATLIGGISLLVLVLIRAIALWRSVEEPAAHSHDHDHCGHDHDCGHDHAHEHHHHGHSHEHAHEHHHHEHSHAAGDDHGHDHGWAPWRYVVLLLPVVLFFLNLPNQGFSAAQGDRVSDVELDLSGAVRSTGQAPPEIGFTQLQQMSLSPESRGSIEGKTITLTGQYNGNSSKRFTLVRYKMACCARDAVPLNAVIMIDPKSSEKIDPDHYRGKWVEVRGLVHYFQKPDTNEYITALILYPTEDKPLDEFIKEIPPPSNPFLN